MTTIFLKLGGSLITDKAGPRTVRPQTLARLMREIAAACAARPELQLVLGHGSGSFGHVEAKKYGTRDGVRTPDEWRGFAEVQWVAAQLNRLVVDAAREAGLPVVNFPPSASALAHEAVIESLAVEPIRAALERGLLPIVQGDVAFDRERGGTILSTEDVFRFLVPRLHPQRILLAGIERGVLTHWPDGDVIPELTDVPNAATTSHVADVTGGMVSKIRETLAMMASASNCEALIFSGEEPGFVQRALLGERVPGTLVSSER